MSEFNLGPFRIKPTGAFNANRAYKYLDLVTYNGGSYLCTHNDIVDGTSCVGILPCGEAKSESYWQCIASKGDKGTAVDAYKAFINVTNGIWDYSVSDKIKIPQGSVNRIQILNAYDGCCGIILSKEELILPENSMKSYDFNYVTISNNNQIYMYSFVYCESVFNAGSGFIWNRSVINT